MAIIAIEQCQFFSLHPRAYSPRKWIETPPYQDEVSRHCVNLITFCFVRLVAIAHIN